ncbi:MAG: hypothetical protein IT249_16595 [Chitinophagaceae bacterium]|nr:hypothetical protein [Chitinophagaceae bacterium]
MKYLLKIIAKYYPKNISGFSEAYYTTRETLLRNKLQANDTTHWASFFQELRNAFPDQIIEDRTDEEVSNIFLLYFFKNNHINQIVWHISKLGEFYCFYSNYVNDRAITLPLKANEQSSPYKNGENYVRKWNDVNENFILAIEKIIQIQNFYYPKYKILTKETLLKIASDFSTSNFELGEASIFNLLFSQHIYP